MALGGVATGSMNAIEAPMAAAVINASGSTPTEGPSAAITGRPRVAVAVFEVISVTNTKVIATAAMINRSGRPASTASSPPSHFVTPVDAKAAASDRPPPNSTRMSHGILAAWAQSRTMVRRPSRLRVGQRKSSSAAVMAMVESPTPGSSVWMPGMVRSPICFGARKIQENAASTKTKAVTRSAGCQGPSFSCSRSMRSAAPAMGRPGRRKSTKQSSAQQATSITTLTGSAMVIHRANDTSMSRSSSASPASTALGGVPIKVATPPMDPA